MEILKSMLGKNATTKMRLKLSSLYSIYQVTVQAVTT
jgi:hypothetical protein